MALLSSPRKAVPSQEKPLMTSTSSEVPSSGSGWTDEHRNSNRGITGKKREILLATAVIVLPMLIFSAVLLGLVFHRRVRQTPSKASNLDLPANLCESGVYYVKISATTLVFIASWSSSVAPSLGGFVMLLLSFPLARRILKSSDADDVRRLPTPYQLSVLIGLVNGGIVWLWRFTTYVFGWKRSKARTIPAVRLAAAALSLTFLFAYVGRPVVVTSHQRGIALTLDSALIVAADTWLHVATKTVQFVQVVPQSTATRAYGRGINADCAADRIDLERYGLEPCNINRAATNIFLVEPTESYRTLSNISDINRVRQTTIDGHSYAYFSDATIPNNIDFTATTVAMRTRCTPVSRRCNLEAVSGASTLYLCSDSYGGELGEKSPDKAVNDGMDYFDDAGATINATLRTGTNPFFFGYNAIVDSATGSDYGINNDPDIVNPIHGGTGFVLYCNATVYDARYSWVNGSVSAFEVTPANVSMARLLRAPMYETGFANNALGEAAKVAAFSDTAQELADKLAASYSQIAVALSAGVFSPRLNVEEQVRTGFLVARVPRAPLFLLVALNLLYAAVGLVLAVVALAIGSDGSSGSGRGRVKDVQAYLSFQALAAELFEPLPEAEGEPVAQIEELFGEREGRDGARVALRQTVAGRWKYQVLEVGGA